MNEDICPGKNFIASFRNVNLKARSTKEGMIYRFEAEITEEDWDLLRSADLTGSLFEASLECVEVGQKKQAEKADRKIGGPLSKNAAQMCDVPEFQEFAGEWLLENKVSLELHSEKNDYACLMIYKVCEIQSRSELDHNLEAAKRFHALMGQYRKWMVEG